MRTLFKITLALILLTLVTSCGEVFLSVKPNKKIVVPTSLPDIQALLDNSAIFNKETPFFGEIASDDYYVTEDRWHSLSVPPQKNAYIWANDVYEGYVDILDWVYSYERVFYANIALEATEAYSFHNESEKQQLSHLKGAALFLRAKSFFEVAQIFCAPFDKNTAISDLGIPLKLEADLEGQIYRSTVKQTYDRIVADLLEAASLLPSRSGYKTRPQKSAAWAMLAKVYLLMYDYPEALRYAELCLQHDSELLDYNLINTQLSFPFPQFNDEVIFHSTMSSAAILAQSRLIVDPELKSLYTDTDIRPVAFFIPGNNGTFKGSYGGGTQLFTGLSKNEVWLTKSECLIRQGSVKQGMETLNGLLRKRHKTGMFLELYPENQEVALNLVLRERRKELPFRGIRWSDLRRLNKEGLGKTIKRSIGNTEYSLLPNDNKYTFPIPDMVVELSGLPQNPR